MNKDDLKEIKEIVEAAVGEKVTKAVEAAVEKHMSSVHEEISDFRNEVNERFDMAERRIDKFEAKTDRIEATTGRIDSKLGVFENNEVDKRKQLEVRVTTIEKHIGIDRRMPA